MKVFIITSLISNIFIVHLLQQREIVTLIKTNDMKAFTAQYKVLGLTSDFNVCDCCGKDDLKQTVTLLDNNMGVVIHFGTTCAISANKYPSEKELLQVKEDIKIAKSKISLKHDQLGYLRDIRTIYLFAELNGMSPFDPIASKLLTAKLRDIRSEYLK